MKKEKNNSEGNWFKNKLKKITMNRQTKEDIYDIVYQVGVKERNEKIRIQEELEKLQEVHETDRKYMFDLLEAKDTAQKETIEANKKIAKLEKEILIYKAENELLKKQAEIDELKSDRYKVVKVRATKGSKAEGAKQEIKVSTPKSALNSRVIKKVKEGK